MKIKKGDNVIVITGKSKGEKGKVLKSLPKTQQVVVEGVNIHKKHQRPKTNGGKGTVIDKTFPVHVSNVMLLDSKGKRTRVGVKKVGTKKVRVSKKTDAEI